MVMTDELVNSILNSYEKYPSTARIDEDNIVNRKILIEVVEEIRKLLFPGFFDKDKVTSEYLRYTVGKRLEIIQYHLKIQIAKALGNCEDCNEDERCCILNEAQRIVTEFTESIPRIRDYLATDIQAAYNGDPAAYSTDEIIFCYPGVFAMTGKRIAS